MLLLQFANCFSIYRLLVPFSIHSTSEVFVSCLFINRNKQVTKNTHLASCDREGISDYCYSVGLLENRSEKITTQRIRLK